MDDLISRKAAIEVLEKWESESVWDEWLYEHRNEPGCEPPSLMVKQLPSAQPERRWIPCSERLPEEYGVYRITWMTSALKKRFVCDAAYEGTDEWDDKRDDFKGKWLLDDFIAAYYPNIKVIAWKPIEEPYAERREE